MSFVSQPIEFGVRFKLLKIYAIIWKLGWNTPYLVAIRWVLFPNLLNLVLNLTCWNFMQITWKDGWNMSYLVAIDVFWPPLMYWIKSKIKVKVQN
jgi:hypothetical protein